jgi:hypothetical protein
LRGGGELLAEVAGLDFDAAEKFVVGGIDEGVGQAFQQGSGLTLQLGEKPLAALVPSFGLLSDLQRWFC